MYKINYHPPTQRASTYYTPQSPLTSWGSPTSYGATSYGATPYYQSATQLEEPPNPLVAITPDLLTRVTTAGTTNPTLANLLRLAATRQATQEELERLGALIQSLATVPEEVFPVQPPLQQIPTTPVKLPDLVVEFRERAGTQFLLPRGPSLCERVESPSGDGGHDIMLTTCLRVPKATASISSDAQEPEETEDVITFRFANTSEELWLFLLSWIGDSTEENQKTIERKVIKITPATQPSTNPGQLAKLPARRYLKHRLPEGDETLAQLRRVSCDRQQKLVSELGSQITPPFSTKSIQPSKSSEAAARRRHTLSEGRIKSRPGSNLSTPGPARSPERQKRTPKPPQDFAADN